LQPFFSHTRTPQRGPGENRNGGVYGKGILGERIWYKYWPTQVPKCLDYPDCTLAEFLKATATKHGSKPAIIFLDAQVTYQELWEKVQRFATALAGLGLKKGDVCALMLPIRFSSLYLFMPASSLASPSPPSILPTRLGDPASAQGFGREGSDHPGRCFVEAREGIKGTRVGTVIGTNIVDLCGFRHLRFSSASFEENPCR